MEHWVIALLVTLHLQLWLQQTATQQKLHTFQVYFPIICFTVTICIHVSTAHSLNLCLHTMMQYNKYVHLIGTELSRNDLCQWSIVSNEFNAKVIRGYKLWERAEISEEEAFSATGCFPS